MELIYVFCGELEDELWIHGAVNTQSQTRDYDGENAPWNDNDPQHILSLLFTENRNRYI